MFTKLILIITTIFFNINSFASNTQSKPIFELFEEGKALVVFFGSDSLVTKIGHIYNPSCSLNFKISQKEDKLLKEGTSFLLTEYNYYGDAIYESCHYDDIGCEVKNGSRGVHMGFNKSSYRFLSHEAVGLTIKLPHTQSEININQLNKTCENLYFKIIDNPNLKDF